MGQTALEGMPEPAVLRLETIDGQVLVTCGRSLLYRYEADDIGMRNLAIVALTDARRRVDEVAAVFGLTATYVSILRGRARVAGSAGLVRRRGRPTKLSDRQVTQAREWAGQGRSQQAIADRLGVAQSVISELLARRGPLPVQQTLPEPDDTAPDTTPEAAPTMAGPGDTAPGDAEPEVAPTMAGPVEAVDAEPVAAVAGTARISTETLPCRYAGAMLLHAYLDRVGAEAIFAPLAGGPARRYDDLAVLCTATLGFAWGIDTIEGAKHLRRAEAGAAIGLGAVPELKTLRTRLGALADGTDRWRCSGRSPRGCWPPTRPGRRCTSSMTTSCPTPAPGRSARAGTPNAATRGPAATTPCSLMPAAAPWSSPVVSRPGCPRACPACWPSCVR